MEATFLDPAESTLQVHTNGKATKNKLSMVIFSGDMDKVMADYVQAGRLTLDPSANNELITYHDSCNLGRKGGVLEEARTVLHAAAQNFIELTPNREEAYCCGGGAGLVALPEAFDIRMLAGKPKADQVKRSRAQIVVAACENCRLQLGDLNGHYGLGVGVTALADLVIKAMRLPGASETAEAKMVEGASVEKYSI